MAEYNESLGFGVDFTASLGQMVAGIAQANAMRAQGAYERKVAEMNARFAEMEAKEVIEAGNREASEHGRKINQMVGAQRARFAGGNIKVGSGSALQIQKQTMELGREEQRTIRNNAWRRAFGLKTESFNYRQRGEAAESRALAGGGATLATSALGFAKDLNEAYRKSGTRQRTSLDELFDPADIARKETRPEMTARTA